MVFLQNDFYTASGSVKLFNCWTDKVTKFDTSSFYNWEQDNLPLYDLEERTYYLWEKLGHPTSSIPGIAMVVSAGASPSLYACNPYIYETVSAAIAALPEVLNYPVIIEVCNKGDLGEINLNNIKCNKNGHYKGSLEIVNKVFAKNEPSQMQSGGTIATQTKVSILAAGSNYDLLGYLSGTPLLGGRKHFFDTKSEFLNQKIFTSYNDLSSLGLQLNGLAMLASDGGYNPPTYAISSTAAVGYGDDVFELAFYESTAEATSTENIFTYDISSYNEVDNSRLQFKLGLSQNILSPSFYPFVGLFMGNRVSKINITNCDGPIYIRNFFVDGRGPFVNNSYGITVNNSENVYLENCISVRNRKAGFYFNNSNVILTRGVAAYRNYNSPRTVTNLSSTYEDDLGAGLFAVNSDIYFSSTSAFEYSLALADSNYSAVINSPNNLAYGLNYPINFSRNANGIVLENSKLRGGVIGFHGNSVQNTPTQLISDMNMFAGIKMNNSVLDWDGRLTLEGNDTGLLANNSLIKTDRHLIRNNQKVGIDLNNSKFVYNKNFIKVNNPIQFYLSGNGIHLDLDKSSYECEIVNNMPIKIGKHTLENSHGISKTGNNTGISLPSIQSFNSSKCLLVHPFIRRTNDFVKNSGFYFELKEGLAAFAKNNSVITFKGSNQYATRIVGPTNKDKQRVSVGLQADNNSELNIQGPSVIAQFSIDSLVENNSVLNITPHRNDNNKFEIAEFELSSNSNHTMVELHSTRACLVADKNSIINLTNLGNYLTEWPNSANGANYLVNNDLDLSGVQPYLGPFTQGGFLQFYPNPFAIDGNYSNYAVTSINFDSAENFTASSYLFDRASVTGAEQYTNITQGGMCVKAHNNSVVNVRGVNFPCGWWNPSALIFNSNIGASNCTKLFIWNIADNSQLNAAYCSVSSMFPEDVSYNGPPAVWLSALTNEWLLSGTRLSGAPTTTPDTSSLSILDYFGSGPSGQIQSYLFTSSYQNKGPFRLYFSVNPASQYLNLVSGVVTGTTASYYDVDWLFQIYAQGYQPPFSASAVSSASSFHKSLINTSTKSLSGFYYGSAMIHSPNFIRVTLDESAANIFANAKHCSTGKSGLARLVSIASHNRTTSPWPGFFGEGAGVTQNRNISAGLASINVFDLNRYL